MLVKVSKIEELVSAVRLSYKIYYESDNKEMTLLSNDTVTGMSLGDLLMMISMEKIYFEKI